MEGPPTTYHLPCPGPITAADGGQPHISHFYKIEAMTLIVRLISKRPFRQIRDFSVAKASHFTTDLLHLDYKGRNFFMLG